MGGNDEETSAHVHTIAGLVLDQIDFEVDFVLAGRGEVLGIVQDVRDRTGHVPFGRLFGDELDFDIHRFGFGFL